MYKRFTKKLLDSFSPLDILVFTLHETVRTIGTGKEDKERLNTYINASKEYHKIIKQYFYEIQKIDVASHFENYSDLKEHFASLEETTWEFQKKDRYYAHPSDSIRLKLGKKGKLALLNVHWTFVGTVNGFRKLFKRAPFPKNYKKHRIKKQKLAELVFFIQFLENATPVIEDVFHFRHSLFQKIKSLDEQLEREVILNHGLQIEDLEIELTAIEKEIEDKRQSIQNHFRALAKDLSVNFEVLYEKFGTIEFPARKVRTKKLKKQSARLLKIHERIFNEYHVRAFALFEHWRLNYEVRFPRLSTSLLFLQYSENLSSVLNEKLISNDRKVVEHLNSAVSSLQEKQDLSEIQENLLSKRLLKEEIPRYIEMVLETDMSTFLDTLLDRSIQEFQDITTTYRLSLKKNSENLHASSQLKETNISNILRDCINEFIEESITREKSELIQKIQTSILNARELSGIIEYALEYYGAEDSGNAASQHAEFVNGIERAAQKAEENKQHNITFLEHLTNQLNLINSSFNTEIKNALSPENIHQKQMELLRKKRLNHARQSLFAIYHFLSETVTDSYKRAHFWVNLARSKYFSYRQALGLSTTTVTIGSELSNYLSATETAIAKLPLMYQKLFRVAPLENEKLRIPRPLVINQMGEAYSNWSNGRFAPTCLVGEIGSGSTTTTNIFIENFGHQYPVHRFNLDHKIIEEKEFLQFLRTVFDKINFKTLEELTEKIQHLKSKQIIIIENIQHLFLRRSKGFANLQLLFRLISETNSKVFWLCTCSIYTWKYLNYTVKASSRFGHIVYLDTLNNEQIIEIITKRHKPSGFKLSFIPPNNFIPRRNYKKMTDAEQQLFLQNDFFKRLYNFAQNNLSLALIFWLRSVVTVDNNNFILQYKELDYSFLNSLNNQQNATLHALLIHENLTQEEHAEIFGWNTKDSFDHLKIFYEDGLLTKYDGRYTINPLVYRQVVKHLNSLKFIH